MTIKSNSQHPRAPVFVGRLIGLFLTMWLVAFRFEGQELIIPVIPTPPTTTSMSNVLPPLIHIVEAGDMPLSIALQYDSTAEAIMQANGIFNPAGLQIGQELIIPTGDELSKINFQAKTALHTQYGSTVEDILEANPDIEPTSLQIGQQVAIPITQPLGKQINYATQSNNSRPPAIIIPDPPGPGLVGLQQQMLLAVNAHREAQGLRPYIADEQLHDIAWARAQDMDRRAYFGHVNPEGKRAKDIMREQGLTGSWAGENIQRNVRPVGETVEYAIAWFMDDAPHRHNILHPHYDRIGIGVSKNANLHTFVLVFASNQ